LVWRRAQEATGAVRQESMQGSALKDKTSMKAHKAIEKMKVLKIENFWHHPLLLKFKGIVLKVKGKKSMKASNAMETLEPHPPMLWAMKALKAKVRAMKAPEAKMETMKAHRAALSEADGE